MTEFELFVTGCALGVVVWFGVVDIMILRQAALNRLMRRSEGQIRWQLRAYERSFDLR